MRSVKKSRYSIKQLAVSILVVAFATILVFRVASYGVLSLIILAALVYSFYLLIKSRATSDILVCFFVYLLNLILTLVFIVAWL